MKTTAISRVAIKSVAVSSLLAVPQRFNSTIKVFPALILLPSVLVVGGNNIITLEIGNGYLSELWELLETSTEILEVLASIKDVLLFIGKPSVLN